MKALPREALDVPMISFEGTLREYFKSMLLSLWKQREGFSGKRPLGDSGWDWEIYKVLTLAGYLEGDAGDGYLADLVTPYTVADRLIHDLIAEHF